MRFIVLLSLTTLLAGVGSVAGVHAADPTDPIDAIGEQQKAEDILHHVYSLYGGEQQAREQTAALADDKVGLCRLCHGADGNSSKIEFPSLAGERPVYLLQRLLQLKQGDNESRTASRIARRLSREQMVAMALYYSAQIRYPVPYDPDLAARGKPLYKAICRKCHLPDGRGKPGMPVLAGQQPEYIARTLVNFREHPGWRHSDEMPKRVRRLDPKEIQSIAAYAASLND
jgi:cytochrome c553